MRRFSYFSRPRYVALPAPPSNIIPNVALVLPTAGQSFSAPATVNLAATATDPDGTIDRVEFYRENTLIATVIDPSPTNYALASNGGVATGSSNIPSGNWPASAAINGDRKGTGWGAGTGGWNDNTPSVWPDWFEVDFGVARDIGEIDVFTIQDNYAAPIVPTLSTTFSVYGIRDFQVQYWNGSIWVDVPGGNVTGNTFVWRQFIFTPINTTKIRVLGNAGTGADPYTRIVELEAWAAGTGTTYNAVDVNVPAGSYNYLVKGYDNFVPEGVNTSLPVLVTVSTPVQPPIPPPSGQPSLRVLVHEGAAEGPNWFQANKPLRYTWTNPGGDYRDASDTVWGGNHYAAVGIGNAAKHRMTIPSSAGMIALVNRLRLDNTGFYFYGTMFFNISAKENTVGDAPPTLTVIANGVTYTPTLTHDSWMDESTNLCLGGQGDDFGYGTEVNRNRVILKFDLSQIVGTVTSATLALTFQGVGTLYVNYLDMPALITQPATQIPGAVIEAGLRGTYTEAQLADGTTVPAILQYTKMTPADLQAKWTNLGGDFNVLQSQASDGGGPPLNRWVWKTWPDYGVDVLRIGTRNYGSLAQPFYSQTLLSMKKFFYPTRYEELYVGCAMMVDADVKLGFFDYAVKLPPTMCNQSAFDLPPDDDYWSTRMEMGGLLSGSSLAHPGVYRWFGYDYDVDRVFNEAINPARGREDFTSMSLVEGHIYWTERRLKMNTFTGSTPNRDGIDEIWVDGVKVFSAYNRLFTANPVNKIDVSEFICFHGGGTSPRTDIHFEFGPQVISTQLIGPMRRNYPAWRQGMPVGQFSDIPNTRLDSIPYTGVAFDDWCGLCLDYVGGRWFSAANGGHSSTNSPADPNAPNGVFGIDFMVAQPVWYTLKPSTPIPDIIHDQLYYFDNTPTARHSYYFQHFVPSRNACFLLGCPVGFGDGIPGAGNVDEFKLATGQWTINGTWNPQRTQFFPAYQYEFNPVKNTEVCCAQDRRNGNIYVAGLPQGTANGYWMRWNASTATFTVLLFSQSTYWHASGTCIDVIRNKWLCAMNTNFQEDPNFDGPKEIRIFNLTTGALEATRIVSGAAAYGSQAWWGKNTAFVHDTDRDKYLIMTGNGRVLEIDPNTFVGNVIIGADTNPYNGPFNRFEYLPALKGCVYAPRTQANLKFLPLAT